MNKRARCGAAADAGVPCKGLRGLSRVPVAAFFHFARPAANRARTRLHFFERGIGDAGRNAAA
ncbi:hypothetical protein BLAT2472_70306 [Burkholderia latens]